MKIFCKTCNSENWVANGNTTFCVKCGQPIEKHIEFAIYTNSQMEKIKEQAYNEGFTDGVEQGFDIGYTIGVDDKNKNGSSDFVYNKFLKIVDDKNKNDFSDFIYNRFLKKE